MKQYIKILLCFLLINFIVGGVGFSFGLNHRINPFLTAIIVLAVFHAVSYIPKARGFIQRCTLPGVNILLQNGTLGGLLQTNDGICGMVLTGVTEGSYTAGNCLLLKSYADLATAGITAANNAFADKQVSEFYAEAGAGASLYLMLVANTMTASQMADSTNASGAVKLLDFSGRTIRHLGLLRNTVGQTITQANGMDNNIPTAITNAQSLATTYAGNPKNFPFRVVLGAQKFDNTAYASLVDGNTLTANRVSVLVGDTANGEGAAVGLYLGRKAKIPVQRKVSRVKDGALNIATAYIGSTLAEQYTNTDTIHDKRFITFRTFAGKTGYFFSDDPTRTATTDDYAYACRGAVIDKAQIISYATYVNEVGGEVPIDSAGKMDSGYCKYLEKLIEQQINGIMTAKREISKVSCFVDPDQNILTNNKVSVVLKVTPVGYANTIEESLGFATS